MNTTASLKQMKELRLHGMAHTYGQQLELPIHQQLDAHQLVGQLLQSEQLFRQQEKTAYYLKLAKLRLPAIPEQISCSAARNPTIEGDLGLNDATKAIKTLAHIGSSRIQIIGIGS